MIDLQQYRATIGLFTHGNSKKGDGNVDTDTSISLAVRGLFFALLILSGDVEANPGPVTGEIKDHQTRSKSKGLFFYAVAEGRWKAVFNIRSNEYDGKVRAWVDHHSNNQHKRFSTEEDAVKYMNNNNLYDFDILDSHLNVIKRIGTGGDNGEHQTITTTSSLPTTIEPNDLQEAIPDVNQTPEHHTADIQPETTANPEAAMTFFPVPDTMDTPSEPCHQTNNQLQAESTHIQIALLDQETPILEEVPTYDTSQTLPETPGCKCPCKQELIHLRLLKEEIQVKLDELTAENRILKAQVTLLQRNENAKEEEAVETPSELGARDGPNVGNERPFESRANQQEGRKRSICLFTASHGRGLADQLNNGSLECHTNLYPGRTMKQVADKMEETTEEEKKSDEVILWAGTNDIQPGMSSHTLVSNLNTIRRVSRQLIGRLTIMAIPYRYDETGYTAWYNHEIARLNEYMEQWCTNNRIGFLRLPTLQRNHYTRHGLHLNYAGKQLVAQAISNYTLNTDHNFL